MNILLIVFLVALTLFLISLLFYPWDKGVAKKSKEKKEVEDKSQTGAAPAGAAPATGGTNAQANTTTTTSSTRTTPPQQVVVNNRGGGMSGWGFAWKLTSTLIILAVIGWIIWFVSFSDYMSDTRTAWKQNQEESKLEYHYITLGRSGKYTEHSTNFMDDPEKEFQKIAPQAPVPGSFLFDTRRHRICWAWRPKSAKGATYYFRCWGRKHECWSLDSSQDDCRLVFLKSGVWRPDQDWTCGNVVKETEVLEVWNDAKFGSVRLKFMDQKREFAAH